METSVDSSVQNDMNDKNEVVPSKLLLATSPLYTYTPVNH